GVRWVRLRRNRHRRALRRPQLPAAPDPDLRPVVPPALRLRGRLRLRRVLSDPDAARPRRPAWRSRVPWLYGARRGDRRGDRRRADVAGGRAPPPEHPLLVPPRGAPPGTPLRRAGFP